MGELAAEELALGAQPEDDNTREEFSTEENAQPDEWCNDRIGSLAWHGFYEPPIPFTHAHRFRDAFEDNPFNAAQ